MVRAQKEPLRPFEEAEDQALKRVSRVSSEWVDTVRRARAIQIVAPGGTPWLGRHGRPVSGARRRWRSWSAASTAGAEGVAVCCGARAARDLRHGGADRGRGAARAAAARRSDGDVVALDAATAAAAGRVAARRYARCGGLCESASLTLTPRRIAVAVPHGGQRHPLFRRVPRA